MCKVLSVAALAGGLWLLYLGYERQESLAGSAESAVARIGQKVDGTDRLTEANEYYVAGAILTLAGVIGLGVFRK
jgi:threonine/homoserine/homoserine lactone efflux protein